MGSCGEMGGDLETCEDMWGDVGSTSGVLWRPVESCGDYKGCICGDMWGDVRDISIEDSP